MELELKVIDNGVLLTRKCVGMMDVTTCFGDNEELIIAIARLLISPEFAAKINFR